MIESSPRIESLSGPDMPPAPVVNLFSASYRWWKLAADPAGKVLPVLTGVTSGVVWRSSVAQVPCVAPSNTMSGPCPCGLHAPAGAVAHARALSSVVAGGPVRVLSVVDGPSIGRPRPHALIAIEGPLQLHAWCDGPQDGVTLTRCDAPPRWISTNGAVRAVCRRHRSEVPPRLRQHLRSLRDFEAELAAGLAKRYGVDVAVPSQTGGHVDGHHGFPAAVRRLRILRKGTSAAL